MTSAREIDPHGEIPTDQLRLCPFVQRTQVILREKEVDFDIDYVDLSNKPDWFVALLPTGKVPTLEVTTDDGEQVVLFESLVISVIGVRVDTG